MTTMTAIMAPRRLLVVFTTLLSLVGGLLSSDNLVHPQYYDGPAAGRMVHGVGITDPDGNFFLGGLNPNADADKGYPMWCVHMWRIPQKPTDTTSISTLTEVKDWAPADIKVTVPQMAWILNEYQASKEATSRAALAYLIHTNFEEPDPEMGHPDAQASVNLMINAVKAQLPDVHARAAQYAEKARASAVSGYKAGEASGEGKRTGTVYGAGVLSETGYVEGIDMTMVLEGPAIFDETGKNTWTGKSQAEGIDLKWTATGNGKVKLHTKFQNLPRQTLTRFRMGSPVQDEFSYGNRDLVGDPMEVTKEGPTWEVIYDFQPMLKSNVPDKTVSKGDVLSDVLTVFADPDYGSGEWFKVPGSDKFVPVHFEGTAYLVGDLPAAKPVEVPKDAKVIGSASFTANGPGEYTAKLKEPAKEPGFVTWVWKAVKDNQPEDVREFIHADFSDMYGVAAETTSVPHEAEIDSSLSIRETKRGIYLVDDLWVEGMPSDHPSFKGDDRFAADTTELTQRLLFFPTDLEVSDENAPNAEVIGEVSLPARNGFFPSVGSTEFKMKLDEAGKQVPGTYVFVTSFAGDDRVKALTTSVTDTTEQYVITPEPLKVRTKATPKIVVGEKAHDTAIVEGTVPEGATVGFELYKSKNSAKPTCTPEERVFTSKDVALNGPGEYVSEDTVLNEAGTYYWVETVRDSSGATVHRGECGLPDETTVVRPKDNSGDGDKRLPETGATVGGLAALVGLFAAGGSGLLYAKRKRS